MKHQFAAALALLVLAAPAWANIGRVKTASGAVHIERGGQKIAVKPGTVVEAGDVLVTGAKSRMGVTFIDNTRMAAGPGSRMTVRTFDYNDTTYSGRFVTDLAKGTLAIVAGRIARNGPEAMRVNSGKSTFVIKAGRVVVKAAGQ